MCSPLYTYTTSHLIALLKAAAFVVVVVLHALKKGEESLLHRRHNRALWIRVLSLINIARVQGPVPRDLVEPGQVCVEVVLEINNVRIYIADEALVSIDVLGPQAVELVANALVRGHKVKYLIAKVEASVPAAERTCLVLRYGEVHQRLDDI